MYISNTFSDLAVGTIAGIHFLIAAAEILLPTRLLRLKEFDFTPAEAGKAGPIVANAGLYNGFLAAGLLWSATSGADSVRYFLLGCVMVAGVFGAFTLKAPKALALQTIPALIAACLVGFTAR